MQEIPVFFYLYFCLLSNKCDFQSVWRVLPVCPCTPALYKMHDFLLPDLWPPPFLSSYLAPVCSNILTQFSSVAQSCPTLCDPMKARLSCPSQTPGVYSNSCNWVVMPSNHLIPSPPTFNLSSHQGLFQRASSSHQVAKYWSFSFSISPSNEYSGVISFRITWLELLAVQGTLKNESQGINGALGQMVGVPSLLTNTPSWNYLDSRG